MALKLNQPLPPETKQSDFERLADWLGHVIVLAPTEIRDIKTKNGDSTVTVCDAWGLKDGEVVDLGEQFVFWSRVRSQLAPLVGSGEATVGRLAQDGRAYQLEEAGTDELAVVSKHFDF